MHDDAETAKAVAVAPALHRSTGREVGGSLSGLGHLSPHVAPAEGHRSSPLVVEDQRVVDAAVQSHAGSVAP